MERALVEPQAVTRCTCKCVWEALNHAVELIYHIAAICIVVYAATKLDELQSYDDLLAQIQFTQGLYATLSAGFASLETVDGQLQSDMEAAQSLYTSLELQVGRLGGDVNVSQCVCPANSNCNISPAQQLECTLQQFQATYRYNGCYFSQLDPLTITTTDATCTYICIGSVSNSYCTVMQ